MYFFKIREVEVTPSTNDEAKLAAASGEPDGLVIYALRQTSGKGRQGREWDSPEGNLYASVLLRPDCSPQEAGCYSFVAALAVHDTVAAFLPDAEVRLKWPNDVLANGKKISGILLEAAPVENGKVAWLVVGVGINVLRYPENAIYPATSLIAEAAEAKVLAVQSVLTTFLNHFSRWRVAMESGGFKPIRATWLAKARTGQMTVRLPNETLEGQFAGLDESGRLIVKLADGAERAISAGDVFF